MVEWKRPVSVMLDPIVIDEIDKERGRVSRSDYLRTVIKNRVKFEVKI